MSIRVALLLLAVNLHASGARAQYLGHDIRGDNGLSAGSAPLPGIYFVLPYLNDDIGRLRDRDGHDRGASLVEPKVEGWGAMVVVMTQTKILGAAYGFAVAPLFYMQDTIDVPRAGLRKETGFTYFDTFYQPVILGWTTTQADFVAGYGFFAPTGDFSTHSGLGMWSHDISGGTTVYFGKARRASAATTATLELHSKKQGVDIHVGNILTLEGGVGARFLNGAGAAGLAYYAQWKLTDDTGSDIPTVALDALNLLGKQRLYGFGPELTIPFFAKGASVGLVTARYFWETHARSSFEGQTFFVAFTVGKLWLS